MYVLLKKEISDFFSSLTGYLVIIVFLLGTGGLMWLLPGEYNILAAGYANIDPLFIMAPIIFLFLVPAITMRMLSDEKKSGTIEMLLTSPLTDLQIILAKYFAALSLVLFSLLPTGIYFFSVYWLGAEVGNIDTGGTLGSYIGLFFLAAIYTAIGILSSSVTDNQLVAFIIGVLLSLLMLVGFEILAQFKQLEFLSNLGIYKHYQSMSRGVIDTRDLVYFVSIVALFLLFSKTMLESRKW